VARLRLERAEEVVLEMVLVVLERLAAGRDEAAPVVAAPDTSSAIAPDIAVSAVSVVMAVAVDAGTEPATSVTFPVFAKAGCKLDSRGGSVGRCNAIFWFMTTDVEYGTRCPNFASSASRPSHDGCARFDSSMWKASPTYAVSGVPGLVGGVSEFGVPAEAVSEGTEERELAGEFDR